MAQKKNRKIQRFVDQKFGNAKLLVADTESETIVKLVNLLRNGKCPVLLFCKCDSGEERNASRVLIQCLSSYLNRLRKKKERFDITSDCEMFSECFLIRVKIKHKK